MRLFVAVYPPRPAIDDLAAQVSRLRIGAASAAGINVRLADPANAHLTLAFLGDVAEDRLVDVESTLGLAAETFRGGRDGALQLRLGGGGSFGRGRFTVLWVDVQGDLHGLATLARLIRFGLHRAQLPHDEKPFRAHLTIARPGDRIDRADVMADREALHAYLGPEWPATELVLVRSHPGPHPTHARLSAWPL
ncbi:RNA 2',3'-cyclic phosphodiesterase [Micromonospora sp. NPDC007271]|uniref:RNA 2',3'-cyclic phosphodiesterase n=1 Tax=Micromonospora sp. NPDC007271 TaxID=3154587 RepID=UPI0033E121A8